MGGSSLASRHSAQPGAEELASCLAPTWLLPGSPPADGTGMRHLNCAFSGEGMKPLSNGHASNEVRRSAGAAARLAVCACLLRRPGRQTGWYGEGHASSPDLGFFAARGAQ